LLTFGIAVAGVLAFLKLPVAPLPQIDFPSIMVQAACRAPIPRPWPRPWRRRWNARSGRIAGVTEMTSSSALGTTNITLQFEPRARHQGRRQ
jgi:multidrug efflux pump